jgi:hypothetical protein
MPCSYSLALNGWRRRDARQWRVTDKGWKKFRNTLRHKKSRKETPQEIVQEKGPLPQTFEERLLEDWERGENSLRKKVELPATPKNKKKNHARRERRLATQRRLAEEEKRQRERRERQKRRAEQRERRTATQKKQRLMFPENPAKIQIEGKFNNHWRLPRKSDLGKYAIRKFPGKIRRVWIQQKQ